VIQHYRGAYSVQAMSVFLGVSRSGYYAWTKRMERTDPDQEKLDWVKRVYLQNRKVYGYRRVTQALHRLGILLNHKRVYRLMQKLGLRSVARQRKVYKPLDQLPRLHRYPNLLQRNFSASRPNQTWVTDITYIQTRQGPLYLSVIKDLYDGFIVSYSLSPSNSVALVTSTLRQALSTQQIAGGLALHSDQGGSYCSQEYFLLTQDHLISASMSRPGNCLDKAAMENFFSPLKEEAIYRTQLHTFQPAQELIEDYIHFYNYEQRCQFR
jgi:putative transposase